MSTCPNCNQPYTPGDEVCQYCGFVFPFSTDVLEPGVLMQQRYQIEGLTHSGGMGNVYPAKDTKFSDRLCIVKQVKEPVKSEEDLRKLEAEAIEMSKLSHPNVAMILDHFVEGPFYYLIVEFIRGKTLSEIFHDHQGRLNEDDVIKWGIAMCDVVSYLHRAGVVHRDISPQNVMLTDDGIIKFIDFGTLRELRDIAAGGTAGMGKFGYAPPEQWMGKPELRSDIFALGATIYYLLTGFLPISQEYLEGQGPQSQDFNPVFPLIREKNPEVSQGLEKILSKALQLDIDKRHSSAEELQRDLQSLIEIQAPVLSLENERLDFSKTVAGKENVKQLKVMNAGTARMTGSLAPSKPWLHVVPSTLDMEPGEKVISVTVDARAMSAGTRDSGNITIDTNGGGANIAVDLAIISAAAHTVGTMLFWIGKLKWVLIVLIIAVIAGTVLPNTLLKQPSLTIDTETLTFEDVRPADKSASRNIVISNDGGKVLTGSITSNKNWLTVSPTELKVPYGEETVTVYIDTASLPYGFEDSGVIEIQTNGGTKQIPVDVLVTTTIYRDSFDNTASGWTENSSAAGSARYENGTYVLSAQTPGIIIIGSNPNIGQVTDFILDVDIATLSSPAGNQGIIFRQQETNPPDNFYYFRIDPDAGRCIIEKQMSGKITSIKELTDTAKIKGGQAANHLKIVCRGEQIELYINAIELYSFSDTSITGGTISLAVETGQSGGNVTVGFDNLVIVYPQ